MSWKHKSLMNQLPHYEDIGPVLIPRSTWGGKPTIKGHQQLYLPARFILFKVIPETPNNKYINTCDQKLAWLQKRQRERNNHSDIKYNFIIGTDGFVYEGRGWEFRPSIEKLTWYDFPGVVGEENLGEPMCSKCLYIGFMEDLRDVKEYIAHRMIKAREALIQYGLDHKLIAKLHTRFTLNHKPLIYKRVVRRNNRYSLA